MKCMKLQYNFCRAILLGITWKVKAQCHRPLRQDALQSWKSARLQARPLKQNQRGWWDHLSDGKLVPIPYPPSHQSRIHWPKLSKENHAGQRTQADLAVSQQYTFATWSVGPQGLRDFSTYVWPLFERCFLFSKAEVLALSKLVLTEHPRKYPICFSKCKTYYQYSSWIDSDFQLHLLKAAAYSPISRWVTHVW